MGCGILSWTLVALTSSFCRQPISWFIWSSRSRFCNNSWWVLAWR